jgi:lipopolysaccharide/colanic/teichoic acid biosynthesis glycosyltransferase
MAHVASNPFLSVSSKREAEAGEGVVKPPEAKANGHAEKTRVDQNILDEATLHRMISLERKRSERSGKPFLLMLLDMKDGMATEKNGKVINKVFSALAQTTRETDVMGWYGTNSVGVMFTELNLDDRDLILRTIMNKASEALRQKMLPEQFDRITISFHLFPEEWDHKLPERPSNPALYPDLSKRDSSKKLFTTIKRVMDVVGSVLAIVIASPLFLGIAVAIKLTSKGPVFFRQKRIGQYGVPFVFLKFRSMYVNNDTSVHKAYVTQLIAGEAEPKPSPDGNGESVYKLTKDARITRVGRFIRRLSLDELPQFFHVLHGEMSLVGPRPPIAYEVEAYDIWHRRRVLEAKPGITGLWQVNGRSRVKFDDMVRLDLKYATTWSPWMDIKILLRTPAAVIFGEGAH